MEEVAKDESSLNVLENNNNERRCRPFFLQICEPDSSNDFPGSKSMPSFDSRSRATSEYTETRWTQNSFAKNHFYSILTSMYALVLIVFCIVIELSQQFTPSQWLAETIFYSFMYGTGIVFLLYFYLFLLHPSWYNFILNKCQEKKWFKDFKPLIGASHTGEGAGSLYLRLGTLLFGSIGMVLFGLEGFICISDTKCHNYTIVNLIFASIFTFIQTHFFFTNSKILINRSKNIAKIGIMHLVAVNVWTWLRFVLAKHFAKANKEAKQSTLYGVYATMTQPMEPNSGESIEVAEDSLTAGDFGEKVSSFNYFGDLATLLTTCIIEYSVISAGIMFFIWRSIDDNHKTISRKRKRKSKVRIDCSSSSGGLFIGILFLIFALITIGIYSYFYQQCHYKDAVLVFRIGDETLFFFALFGSIIGLYRMRWLQYTHAHSNNGEFLDELLLFVGLTGELIHSSSGILCFISTQNDKKDKMEFYSIFILLTRITQVIVQSLFILTASRLRCLSSEASKNKPGKQFVTLLLIANVALFFFHSLEGMKSVFGNATENSKTQPFTVLVSIVAPLTVFYRFHSSVCFAEIWKHSYSEKNIQTPVSEFGDDNRNDTHFSFSTMLNENNIEESRVPQIHIHEL